MRVLQHLLLWQLGLAPATTQTTPNERSCLARHAMGRHQAMEVGVWHGVTSKVLLLAMDPVGTFFAVDPYPVGRLGFSAQYIIAHREVAAVGSRRVEWIREVGQAAAAAVQAKADGPLDFIFIDGDHSYEGLRTDWESFTPLTASGTIIALHDSRSHPGRDLQGAGSAVFTREVISRDSQFETIDEVDSLTVVQRKP